MTTHNTPISGTKTPLPPSGSADSSLPPAAPPSRLTVAKVVLRTCIGVGLAIIALWMWHRWDMESFVAWKGEVGPLPYFALLALLPAFGLPTTPFYLLAGATFGIPIALAGVAVSIALNLGLCYWITHSGLRPWLERMLERTRFRIPQVGKRSEVGFTIVTKLLPGIPTFIKNYLICLGGVSFVVYFGISFTVTLIYAAAFIVLGESILDQDYSQGGIALAALVLIAVALRIIQKRVASRTAEQPRPGESSD